MLTAVAPCATLMIHITCFLTNREKHQRLQQQLASMLQQAGDTPRAGAVGAIHVDTRDRERDKSQGSPGASPYSSIQQQGT